ncbi:MAG: META domain-containing protein [Chloroflexota bacterium]
MKWLTENKLFVVVMVILMSLIVSCTPGAGNGGEPTATGSNENELTMYVGAETADCVGVAPQQCLLVKFDPNASWEFEYDGIEGFDYEAGFEYELRVQRIDVPNPPADGSSFYYQLVEVVNKTAVATTVEPTPTEPTTPEEAPLAGTSWVLISYGPDASPQLSLPNSNVTVAFGPNGELTGNGGCNSYFGSYTATTDGSVQINEVAITEMACMEEGLMQQEMDFVATLTAVQSYIFTQHGLELVYDNGRLQLLPETPMLDLPLADTQWQLTTIVNGDTAMSLLAGTEITANFDGERISGSAGCNNYFGPYTLNRNTISFGVLGSTMMACEEGILAQESDYLSLLETVTEANIMGDQLSLVHPNGELIFIAAPPAPPAETDMISWEEAVALLNSGQVTEAFQTHSLEVTLFTVDGNRVTTIEPSIDDIFDAIDACGEPCANIMIATE